MITRELKLRLTTKQKRLLNQWLFNFTRVYNWECSACGAQHDHDINVAKAVLYFGLGYSLDNAGTHACKGPENFRLESLGGAR